MKNKSDQSTPTAEAPTGSTQPGSASLLPPIFAALRAASKAAARIESDKEATETLLAESQKALDAALETADLRDGKQLDNLRTLQTQITLAPLKIASLERLLETTKEELNATKKEAQSVTIRAADEAKRGIAEVIARSIEQHYGSLDEALAVANQSKTAVEWGRLSMFIPSASEEKLASIAERVFTETARLKTAHGK